MQCTGRRHIRCDAEQHVFLGRPALRGADLDDDAGALHAHVSAAVERRLHPALDVDDARHDGAVQRVVQQKLLRLPQKHLQQQRAAFDSVAKAKAWHQLQHEHCPRLRNNAKVSWNGRPAKQLLRREDQRVSTMTSDARC